MEKVCDTSKIKNKWTNYAMENFCFLRNRNKANSKKNSPSGEIVSEEYLH